MGELIYSLVWWSIQFHSLHWFSLFLRFFFAIIHATHPHIHTHTHARTRSMMVPRQTVTTKVTQGAKTFGSFLYSAVNKAGAKIKETVKDNVSMIDWSGWIGHLGRFTGREKSRYDDRPFSPHAKILLQNILGEFSKEQEAFIKGQQGNLQNAGAPWIGHQNEEKVKEEILGLSSVIAYSFVVLLAFGHRHCVPNQTNLVSLPFPPPRPPSTGSSKFRTRSTGWRWFRVQLRPLVSHCTSHHDRRSSIREDALRFGAENHYGGEFLAELLLSRLVDLPGRWFGNVRYSG